MGEDIAKLARLLIYKQIGNTIINIVNIEKRIHLVMGTWLNMWVTLDISRSSGAWALIMCVRL